MADPKIIKRYSNRKLYDTAASRYVTLKDIAAMIRAGDEIEVKDNTSGKDLTSMTFAQIIFEEEKDHNLTPLALLRALIQKPLDGLQSNIESKLKDGAQAVSSKYSTIGRDIADLRKHLAALEERLKRSR